ncbi:MAG: tetratricopeptide repeat protein [Caldimonas sp.]
MIAAVLTIVLLAAPSEAVSRAHFAKAQKAFAQHEWKRALDEFAATSEATPTELPDLWFDIAQCHRNLGHARQAVAAFERYLALKPDAPDRDKVRALVVSLGGHVADDPAPSPAPAAVAAPDEPAPLVAGGPPLEAKPPAGAVAAAASVPLIPPADAPPPKSHRRWKVWTGVAVGVALVAVGVGLGVGLGTANGGGGQSPAIPALGSAATFDTRGH